MNPPSTDQRDQLVIRFADAFAVIACDDATVRHEMGRLFRHCRHETMPAASTVPSVALTIRRDDDAAFVLFGAGSTPCRLSSALDLLERVLYEVTVGLATSSQSAMVVHGAGLVVRDFGILLVGPSGSGKSTLTTRCLVAGYDFLSDEAVAVDRERNDLHGFARPIALKNPNVAFGNSEIRGDYDHVGHGSSGICYLDPERLRSGSVRTRSPLNVLVFPTYTAAGPDEFRRLTPAQTVFRLMPRIVNAQRLPRRGFDSAVAVATATPAYALGYSRAERAIQWLERIVAECSSFDDLPPPVQRRQYPAIDC